MRRFIALFIASLLTVTALFGCKTADSNHAHKDQNDDGTCDVCEVTVYVNFDFYVINDLHGKFDDSDSQPGVDELSSYLRAAQFGNENTILLSSGDMWQGSSESNLTKGNLITDWMNDLNFTAMTMGNHEYDWGEEYIIRNEEIAEFPFLGINIYSVETNERVEYCDASVMIDMNGIQIGVIGAIGDCYSSIASDFTKGIYFKTGAELTALVKEEAISLREQGADFIVYSLHDGYDGKDYSNSLSDDMVSGYYDSVLSDEYVDVIFEGHTHRYYVKQDSHGVYHLQGGGDNVGLIHFDVDINSVTGSYSVVTAEFVGKERYTRSYSADPIVDQLLEKYDEQISVGKEVLGYNKRSRDSQELRKIAADLYFEKGMELWGDEYDIVLGGGFFSVRSPGFLESGDVTYSQLQMIFPFDNQLVLCSIKGKDLREKFFETDHYSYFISYGSYGSQVKQNIDPNGIYYVVVDSYTSTYGPNNLTEIERYQENIFLRDLFADYIQMGLLES